MKRRTTTYKYIVRRRGFYDHVVGGFTSKKAAEHALRAYIRSHPTGNLGMRSKGWVSIQRKSKI
jgi:hypothetical protein